MDNISRTTSTSARPLMAAAGLNAATLCRGAVVTVAEALDLAEAARLMRDRSARYLVVTATHDPSKGSVVGILTDRDIVTSVVAREADPRMLRVGDVMARPPLLIAAEYPLDVLARLMRGAGARCAPVVTAKGELVGVLAYEDVLERLIDHLTPAPDEADRI
jgi:CBS domain-containing protein